MTNTRYTITPTHLTYGLRYLEVGQQRIILQREAFLPRHPLLGGNDLADPSSLRPLGFDLEHVLVEVLELVVGRPEHADVGHVRAGSRVGPVERLDERARESVRVKDAYDAYTGKR